MFIHTLLPIPPWFRQLCICLAFSRFVFVLIMYVMLGQLTCSANGQLYTIKINKDFSLRLQKRGALPTFKIERWEREYKQEDWFVFVSAANNGSKETFCAACHNKLDQRECFTEHYLSLSLSLSLAFIYISNALSSSESCACLQILTSHKDLVIRASTACR